ncbi:unnamed protein product [Laminaria digitata]
MNSCRDKNEGTCRSGEGGGGAPAMCVTPGSEIQKGGSRSSKARIINDMGKKKNSTLICSRHIRCMSVGHSGRYTEVSAGYVSVLDIHLLSAFGRERERERGRRASECRTLGER